jgi:hypothetical protein
MKPRFESGNLTDEDRAIIRRAQPTWPAGERITRALLSYQGDRRDAELMFRAQRTRKK